MPDDFEYFRDKRSDKTYVSKAFGDEAGRMRFISKVFDFSESYQFVDVKEEIVLRETPAGRQEVKALFYEDTRDIKALTIQKYTIKNGKPHKWFFTFQGEEIAKLYKLIHLIRYIQLEKGGKEKFDDEILEELFKSENEKRRFFLDNTEIVMELARNKITKSDIIALAYRKEQLKLFEKLLSDVDFFRRTLTDLQSKSGKKKRGEDVWQEFFEKNPWIFGYGLSYIFKSNLDHRKLEQTIAGYSIQGSGKRVDALMRTRDLVSSLCFVEIKTHETPLLSQNQDPYRAECWQISDKLTGSIAQIQKTVQKALETIKNRIEMQSKTGEPIGETAYLYQPKAFAVIGNLGEFQTEHGINEQKFSSFELFRRNIINPEIITFDELFERAKFIVMNSEEESSSTEENDYDNIDEENADNDIPF